ncbi:MAG: hypothetical protein IKB71_07605 [Lentisphaeria bacterium]|nr:hypothetical protein [Lentisphaeria bacterium]
MIGKWFCVTGRPQNFKYKKDIWEAISKRGGNCCDVVNFPVDYLIVSGNLDYQSPKFKKVMEYISNGRKCQIITEAMLLKMLEENPEISDRGYIFKKGENVPERLQCSSCAEIIAHYNSWDIVPTTAQKQQLKILYDGFSGIGIWVKMFVNSSFCFCIKIPSSVGIWTQIDELEKCFRRILGDEYELLKINYHDINSDKGQELFNKFQRYK